MGLPAISIDNYEADDIIGTFARMADEDECYNATIVSSDKDLLQLISKEVDVKLLKQKDYIIMNEETFRETYGIEPIRIIDLKSLMGDASDNIPGVKGIGEKTALTLLKEYGTLESIYENIETIKGKLKEKLETDKDNAFYSKYLATIYKEVPLNMTFENIKIREKDDKKLLSIYEDLEFFSLIKKEKQKSTNSEDQLSLFGAETNSKTLEQTPVAVETTDVLDIKKPTNIIYPDSIDYEVIEGRFDLDKDFAFYLEMDKENYHFANILGMSIYDGNKIYFLTKRGILENKDIFTHATSTYDLKKAIVVLNSLGIKLPNCTYDTMIASYLLNDNVKEDISYIAKTKGYSVEFYDILVKKAR